VTMLTASHDLHVLRIDSREDVLVRNGVTSITQLRNYVMKILPNIIFFRQSCNRQKHHSPID